jgi:hypothetical protein
MTTETIATLPSQSALLLCSGDHLAKDFAGFLLTILWFIHYKSCLISGKALKIVMMLLKNGLGNL